MDYNQTAIIDKINHYLKSNNRELILEHGYCHGLTLLWLYKMSENKQKWFYDLVKKMVDTPEEKMSDIEMDMEKFIAHIEWLQQPEKYIRSIRQMDMNESVEIPKEIPASSVFNPRQLDSILELVIQPNKMVCISGPDHSVGVFQRDDKFYIYNPNYDSGVAKRINSIKLLRYELIQCLFADFDHPTKKLAVTINVLGEDDVPQKRANIYKWIIHSTGTMNFCDFGIGPLYLACENHNEELARMLLEKGALPNKPTNNGRYPLLLSCYSGYANLVTLLLDFGADPDLEGREGLPLFVASKNGHEEVVKVLLEHNTLINKPDRDGDTAIFGSVEQEHKHITKLLLENGANPLHARNNGDTPMDIAIKEKHWDVVAMMLAYVKAPHERNIRLLKRNKKHILSAVEQLLEANELATDERERVKKILNSIDIKKTRTIKSTKVPELSRRDVVSQYINSDLNRNSIFHHGNTSPSEQVIIHSDYVPV